ncbi:hypothetical protein V6N13_051242 [Hibiscus sabdariffa]
MMIWPCLAALMAVAMALAQQLVGARCCCGRRFPSSDALALSLHRIIAGDGAGHLPIAEHRCAQGPHAPGGDRVSADWFCRCIVFSAGDGTGHLPVAKDAVSLVILVARAALVRHAMGAGQFACHSLCACPGWRMLALLHSSRTYTTLEHASVVLAWPTRGLNATLLCKQASLFGSVYGCLVASMCAWASVPSVPLRLQCIAFCRLRCLALAVQPYVLLPVSCWMRWCAIPWALASAPASSYAHALAGAYTAPWHRAHRSILQSAYSGPLVP